jgi:hypothetical protein
VQWYRYFLTQSSDSGRHNPLCCFSKSVYCCCLLRYRFSPETFGYALVYGKFVTLHSTPRHFQAILTWATNGGTWLASLSGRFTTSVKRAPGNQWIPGWVGPIASLDAVAKRKVTATNGNRMPTVKPQLITCSLNYLVYCATVYIVTSSFLYRQIRYASPEERQKGNHQNPQCTRHSKNPADIQHMKQRQTYSR